MPGYRKEVRDAFAMMKKPLPSASVNSTTETFVAMKMFIDNWRWAGVPFYLRTGKRLPKRASEVAIQFKDVPHVLFNDHPEVPLEPTVLSLRVQPEEGLSMRIASKLPGPKVRIYPVKMEFNYTSSFGGQTPEAYERLLLDVMAGDATLFMRRDAVESAWRFVMPILDHWETHRARDIPGVPVRHVGPHRGRPDHRAGRPAVEDAMTADVLTSDPDYLVPLRDVERTLARQMKALQGPGAAPVQRARMANLVIFCNSLEQAIQINAQVPEVEAVHPARVILVVGEPSRGGVRRDGPRDGAADSHRRRPRARLRRAGDAARGRGGGGTAAVRRAGTADRRSADEPVVGGPAAAAAGRPFAL